MAMFWGKTYLSFSKSFTPIREASFLSRQAVKILRESLNAPGKSGNGYAYFFADKYSSLKGNVASVTEVAKLVGAQWRSLPDAEKQAYLDKAKLKKDEHDKVKEAFNSKLSDREKAMSSLLKLNRKARSGKINRRSLNPLQKELLEEMPKPGAVSARGLFVSQTLKGNQAIAADQRSKMADCIRQWSSLSPEEKKDYEARAQANLANFKSSLLNFLKK